MESIIRGGNWYCDEINMRLFVDTTKLPDLAKAMENYVLGAGFFGLALPGEISPLSAEMSLNATPPVVRARFGREPGDWTTISYYERLLNVFPTNVNGQQAQQPGSGGPKQIGRIVMMKGLLNEVRQPGVKGLKADGPSRLVWSSIVHYHDVVDGTTVHKFDIATNTLIMWGVNYSAEANRLTAA